VEREGSNKRKRKKVQGRIWVYRTPRDEVVFDFTLSRSRDGPTSFLEGFTGYLQGDKYAGYDSICSLLSAEYRWGFWTVSPGGTAPLHAHALDAVE